MVYTISSEDKKISWGLTGDERIVQNVLNIIRTKKYEIPFMRELGLDPDFIDESLQYIRSRISEDIIELVETYEDRAKVIEVNVDRPDSCGNLTYEVRIEV